MVTKLSGDFAAGGANGELDYTNASASKTFIVNFSAYVRRTTSDGDGWIGIRLEKNGAEVTEALNQVVNLDRTSFSGTAHVTLTNGDTLRLAARDSASTGTSVVRWQNAGFNLVEV